MNKETSLVGSLMLLPNAAESPLKKIDKSLLSIKDLMLDQKEGNKSGLLKEEKEVEVEAQIKEVSRVVTVQISEGQSNHQEEPVAMMPAPDGSKSDKQDMNPGKCDLSDCTSGSKGTINKESVQEEEGCCPPTSPYDYNCPGCNGKSSQLDDQEYNSCASGDSYAIDSSKDSQSAGKFSTEKMRESWGSKSDKKYMNPGKWDINSGVKGETHKDPGQEEEACCPITSNYSDYDRNISQLDDQGYTNTTSGCGSYAGSQNYGSEALPCYPSDPPYAEDLTNEMSKCSTRENDLVKPEIQYRPLKTFGKIGSVKRSLTAGKFPSFTSQNHVKGSQPAVKFPPSITQNPVRGFQSSRKYPPLNSQNPVKTPVKGFQPTRKFPPLISQNQGNFVHNGSTNYKPNQGNFVHNGSTNYKPNQGNFVHNGSTNYKPNHNVFNGNMYNSRNRNGHFNASNDIIRGPRIQNTSNHPNETSKDSLELTIERNKYNLEDFKTDYPDAKFYVIKSFSEDDIYKCIKFEVWASTRYGNKKLNDAFLDLMAKSYETGTKCPPTFLFFSVNASGQFVGVAEMIGQVDFNKNMDFWQVDKWNGFFPVKWHVIKDIPNARLRHIILENSENRDVTFTRDTQEIGLEQGIEMLKIFKNHEGKTSLLDDVAFYENRIKLFRKKEKSVKKADYPETETYREYGEDCREYGDDYREYGEDDYREYGEDCREYGEEY